MIIRNTKTQYGIPSISLHWLMAILIITQLSLGLYMVGLPVSIQKLKFYAWHKQIGILILMIVIIRLSWRLLNITPTLSLLPWWEKFAARSVHWALYIFMFFLPITGWLLSSAAGIPPSFFGLFVLPNLIAPNEELRYLLTETHEILAYSLIAILCLHIAAALKHHFIDKDNILRRMFYP